MLAEQQLQLQIYVVFGQRQCFISASELHPMSAVAALNHFVASI
jgi:hypothetical protein